jgi:hypothetical protein
LGIRHLEDPVTALAKAGLGLFEKFGFKGSRGSSKPQPADCSTIVVFIIGGVSFIELCQIQQQLDDYGSLNEEISNLRIIVGSNNIVCPNDVYYDVFKTMNS